VVASAGRNFLCFFIVVAGSILLLVHQLGDMSGAQFHRVCLVLGAWLLCYSANSSVFFLNMFIAVSVLRIGTFNCLSGPRVLLIGVQGYTVYILNWGLY
jgi:hypothetical protein